MSGSSHRPDDDYEIVVRRHVLSRLPQAVRLACYCGLASIALQATRHELTWVLLPTGLGVAGMLVGAGPVARRLGSATPRVAWTSAIALSLLCLLPSLALATTTGATGFPRTAAIIAAMGATGFYVWGLRHQVVFVAGTLLLLGASGYLAAPRAELVTLMAALALSLQLASLIERHHRTSIRAAAALADKQREYEQLASLRERFLRVVAHELRTPMTSIRMAVDALDRYWERLDGEQRRTRLARIGTSIVRMTSTLDEIGTLAREDDTAELTDCSRIDVEALCHAVVRDLADVGEPTDRVEFSFLDEPLAIWSDPAMLKRALRPIVVNALHYSPGDTCVGIVAIPEGRAVRIVVTDRGIGVPPGDVPRVFEPFWRGANAEHVHGVGLGLAAAKRAASRIGATISFVTTPSEGTTVTLAVPTSAAA